MASLKRSTKSFRRQGSSGSIWGNTEDLTDEIDQLMKGEGKLAELRHCHSIGGGGTAARGEVNAAEPPVYKRNLSAPPAKPPLPNSVREGGFSRFLGKLPKLGKHD